VLVEGGYKQGGRGGEASKSRELIEADANILGEGRRASGCAVRRPRG
jgi:hypothetical protein